MNLYLEGVIKTVSANKNIINFANTVFYMSEFDIESIKYKVIEQLKAGKPLLDKDGAFAPFLEIFLMPHWKMRQCPKMDDTIG